MLAVHASCQPSTHVHIRHATWWKKQVNTYDVNFSITPPGKLVSSNVNHFLLWKKWVFYSCNFKNPMLHCTKNAKQISRSQNWNPWKPAGQPKTETLSIRVRCLFFNLYIQRHSWRVRSWMSKTLCECHHLRNICMHITVCYIYTIPCMGSADGTLTLRLIEGLWHTISSNSAVSHTPLQRLPGAGSKLFACLHFHLDFTSHNY